MVNLVAAQKPLLHFMMKMAGVKPHSVEIDPGTVMTFFVPSETLKPDPEKKNPTRKPAVVLVHGFAAEGIVTWQFQVGALTKKYSVYVPDLLFFGGSRTDRPERSPEFQARCLAKALRQLGVEQCVVVGFSYGGMVGFEMARLFPELVSSVVVSGSVLSGTALARRADIDQLGFASSAELLLPSNVEGLKALFAVAVHRKLWIPDRLHRDFLEVMFTNRKERSELLEALIVSEEESVDIPKFSQRIHLLWGENDEIFKQELAQDMKEQLGQNTTFQGIKKAGHLVHLERPCVYNRYLKKFLASLHTKDENLKK